MFFISNCCPVTNGLHVIASLTPFNSWQSVLLQVLVAVLVCLTASFAARKLKKWSHWIKLIFVDAKGEKLQYILLKYSTTVPQHVKSHNNVSSVKYCYNTVVFLALIYCKRQNILCFLNIKIKTSSVCFPNIPLPRCFSLLLPPWCFCHWIDPLYTHKEGFSNVALQWHLALLAQEPSLPLSAVSLLF